MIMNQNLFGHPVDPYRLAASSQNGQSHVVLTTSIYVGSRSLQIWTYEYGFVCQV